MFAEWRALFLLMTIPVQLLLMFVFPHLLPALLDDASHNLSLSAIYESISLYPSKRGRSLSPAFLIDDHIRLRSQNSGECLNSGDDEVAQNIDVRSLH
jgi:hypothetical protein